MSSHVEIKRGSKIDDQDAAKAGGKLGILVTLNLDEQAEGQYFYNGNTQCPYCGSIGFTRGLNSDVYVEVVCGRCGMVFRA